MWSKCCSTTWLWQSNMPGNSVRPETSTRSSPSRPGPTSTTSPFSITTSASATVSDRGSKTAPPLRRVRATRHPDTWVGAGPRGEKSVHRGEALQREQNSGLGLRGRRAESDLEPGKVTQELVRVARLEARASGHEDRASLLDPTFGRLGVRPGGRCAGVRAGVLDRRGD